MTEFAVNRLDEPEPWDRQLQERSDEYLAFTVYRNMGPGRSFAQTARELTLAPSTVSTYAKLHNWQDRVAAWDYYQEKIYQAEMAEHARTMARFQIQVARQALEALSAPVTAMLNKMQMDPEGTLAELAAADVGKLLKLAQDSAKVIPSLMAAERLAMGQPTSITHTESVNVHFTDTERIGEILDVLRATGVLDAVLGTGEAGEIVDAEVVEVHDGDSDAEANSLPASSS